MILCYELPIRFPQDTEAPQNVALIMLFSLTDDEYNHSCAGSESNDTDDYQDTSICAFGRGRNYLCLDREFGGRIADRRKTCRQCDNATEKQPEKKSKMKLFFTCFFRRCLCIRSTLLSSGNMMSVPRSGLPITPVL